MIKRLESLLFYSLIFSIISQFGKHFWPDFSFVHGIRVDYLSPTLYISDILIALLLILVIAQKRKEFVAFILNKKFLLLLCICCLSALFAKVPFASFFGLLKLIEFIFFGFYVAISFKKDQYSSFLRIFLGSSVLVSCIALLEFFFQHSLGNVFYFLGERTFNASTIGIAVFHQHGSSILRPYATFPHPNVLAFYLYTALVLILMNREKIDINKKILSVLLVFPILALLLTFSRTILFLGGAMVMLSLIHKINKKKEIVIGIISIFLVGILFFIFSDRLALASVIKDLSYRSDLFAISWSIFLKNPLLGTGLHNFFIHEISYQKSITPTLLQPVHNIFMYVLVSSGIIGFGIFVHFLKQTYVRIRAQIKKTSRKDKSFFIGVLILFLSALFVGIFDHFLLTVQQGELLFALILGLSYARVNEQE